MKSILKGIVRWCVAIGGTVYLCLSFKKVLTAADPLEVFFNVCVAVFLVAKYGAEVLADLNKALKSLISFLNFCAEFFTTSSGKLNAAFDENEITVPEYERIEETRSIPFIETSSFAGTRPRFRDRNAVLISAIGIPLAVALLLGVGFGTAHIVDKWDRIELAFFEIFKPRMHKDDPTAHTGIGGPVFDDPPIAPPEVYEKEPPRIDSVPLPRSDPRKTFRPRDAWDFPQVR